MKKSKIFLTDKQQKKMLEFFIKTSIPRMIKNKVNNGKDKSEQNE